MPPVVFVNDVVPALGSLDVNLAPYDRFAGGGGELSARLLNASTGARGDLLLTVMVGSDVLVSEGPLQVESAAGVGVTRETPTVTGQGLPADPLTVRLRNTNALARTVVGQVEIRNA